MIVVTAAITALIMGCYFVPTEWLNRRLRREFSRLHNCPCCQQPRPVELIASAEEGAVLPIAPRSKDPRRWQPSSPEPTSVAG